MSVEAVVLLTGAIALVVVPLIAWGIGQILQRAISGNDPKPGGRDPDPENNQQYRG